MSADSATVARRRTRRPTNADRSGRLDELTAWLTAHGGSATRRTLMRSGVFGIRTASELDALVEAYSRAHPDSVTVERAGARGPKAVVVHAVVPTATAR